MIYQARHRAKKFNVPCTITREDISIPETCPVLGIPLVWNSGYGRPNSPSLDRIDPAQGYVPGNVQVISKRANSMKNDGTAQELLAFADWVYKNFDRGDAR
jgi:hypothetical protein